MFNLVFAKLTPNIDFTLIRPVAFCSSAGKTQVGVRLDDDSLKILDELPSSAVEMQVKSKVGHTP